MKRYDEALADLTHAIELDPIGHDYVRLRVTEVARSFFVPHRLGKVEKIHSDQPWKP